MVGRTSGRVCVTILFSLSSERVVELEPQVLQGASRSCLGRSDRPLRRRSPSLLIAEADVCEVPTARTLPRLLIERPAYTGSFTAIGQGSLRVKPETRTVNQLFERDVRYVVPLYQRPYVWDENDQWAPLWEDVLVLLRD